MKNQIRELKKKKIAAKIRRIAREMNHSSSSGNVYLFIFIIFNKLINKLIYLLSTSIIVILRTG